MQGDAAAAAETSTEPSEPSTSIAPLYRTSYYIGLEVNRVKYASSTIDLTIQLQVRLYYGVAIILILSMKKIVHARALKGMALAALTPCRRMLPEHFTVAGGGYHLIDKM